MFTLPPHVLDAIVIVAIIILCADSLAWAIMQQDSRQA
jgi:hypothetical protein